MKLKTLKDKGELNMILSRRELVVTFFALEVEGRIAYQLNYVDWDYPTKDVLRTFTGLTIYNDKDLDKVVDIFCSTMGAKTIILTGLYCERNVDYFPRTLTTKYRVYNYLNSEDKLVPVK